MYYKLDKSKKQKINDNNGSLITIYKFYTAYCISNCNKYIIKYTRIDISDIHTNHNKCI